MNDYVKLSITSYFVNRKHHKEKVQITILIVPADISLMIRSYIYTLNIGIRDAKPSATIANL